MRQVNSPFQYQTFIGYHLYFLKKTKRERKTKDRNKARQIETIIRETDRWIQRQATDEETDRLTNNRNRPTARWRDRYQADRWIQRQGNIQIERQTNRDTERETNDTKQRTALTLYLFKTYNIHRGKKHSKFSTISGIDNIPCFHFLQNTSKGKILYIFQNHR